MKLSAKRLVHVAPMSIFLTLNQMVATLTKVADKSNLHKGGTINLKEPISEECHIQISIQDVNC